MAEMRGSPKEAKAAGKLFYFTGRPCKFGHTSKRRTSTRVCVECDEVRYLNNAAEVKARSSARHAALSAADPNYGKKRYAATAAAQKNYRDANREQRTAGRREWYASNREHALAYAKAYRPTVCPEKKRAQARSSYRRHKPRFIANVAYRRAAQLLRTPKWLTEAHKTEIRGKSVSGLHVPWNLRVIPASDNLAKGNALMQEYT